MASAEEGSPLRRSTRQRKDISYKDIEKAADTPSPPDSSNDLDRLSHKRKRGPKPKPVEPTFSLSADKRANSINSTSREGRIYAMAGSDANHQRQLFDKMEKWKNVFDNVPEELLDYNVGWGTCLGDWNGKGGERQKAKTFSGASEILKSVLKSTTLSIGPKQSRKTINFDPGQATYFPNRRGHVVNIGQPIWALDFLPQPPVEDAGQTQYLAIAGHPNFTSHPKLYTRESGPNIIQIWAIDPHTRMAEGACCLSTLICQTWGTCWGLKFCPYGAYGEGRVGLLAGVFGDGVVRVLDVREQWIGSEGGTVNLSVTEAAWEFDLGTEVMATGVAWKSLSEIVVGCSNGYVAIFDLRDETDNYGIPSFYTAVSDTHILSVASLAPSHPHFITVGSFDGSIHVVDLRSPESDTVLVLRQRAFTSVVTDIPFCGGIVSPDDICGVRYSSFRLLKKGTLLAVHGSAVWDIATSHGTSGAGVHPLILTAGSDGVCSLVNPTSRLLGLSKGAFRNVLFKIEKEGNTIKMWEEFPKREHQELQNFVTTKLFDDHLTITKVAWCPTSATPGLYAAGMRCGLLRIANLNSPSPS